jgi:hypothetical protein
MDGVTMTHSGRVTPAAAASSDESTDNYELGAEVPGEEMDTTTTSTTAATEGAVVGGPDADAATDNLATRYANLDSPADRLDFTRKSIVYLFRTTYTSADSLTIAALVAYMNAALPPDKHEEFDTAEVTRAAKMLHDRGSVAFEGDMLKPLH